MIDARGRDRYLTCDECEAEEIGPFDREDFDILLQEAKEAGWAITKRDGTWHHRCPDCKPSALERARDLFGD